jgi:dihydrofolate reductase
MMTSLDGFINKPDSGLDWTLIDEEIHTFVNNQQAEIDTELYGRRLYEVMTYWETADQDMSTPAHEREYARLWQGTEKIVFSTTLDEVKTRNTRLVKGNLAEEIAQLKQQPGKIISVGGAGLAAACARLGLIDEYQCFVHPVILGSGTPFFPTLDEPIKLRLIETRTFGSGVVYVSYQRVEGV